MKMIEIFGGVVAGEAGDGSRIPEFNRIKPTSSSWTSPCTDGSIEALSASCGSTPTRAFIMVSSVGYQENILAALQKGDQHFVQKPLSPKFSTKSFVTFR